ncbi:MAG: hypothetical protein OES57_16200, partial [Acidimicrobiia bacterium]|nr:hypothetical protein [Acidimicrobiia bacterium]
TSTSTEPARTTIPLVTVPDGAPVTSVPPPTTATTVAPRGGPAPGPTTTAAAPAGAGGSPPPQTVLPPTGIDEIDDTLGDQPVIPPPEGEGTAMRATISPLDGLAVGDVVRIEAENAPPGQLMAWAQCSESAAESSDLGVLLTACAIGGIDRTNADGTVSVTVTVVADLGGVDCTVDTCVVGLVVFPGTDGLRIYEPITLAA